MDEVEGARAIRGFLMGGVVGAAIGFSTYRYCRNRDKVLTGIVGFLCCLVSGVLLGLLGAAPIALLFILFAKLTSHGDYASDSRDSGFAKSMFGCVGILVFLVILCGGLAVLGFYSEGKKSAPSDAGITEILKEGFVKLANRGASSQDNENYRKFTSRDGRGFEGMIIGREGDTVEIVRRDGRIFKTSIYIYSRVDQNYIRSWVP